MLPEEKFAAAAIRSTFNIIKNTRGQITIFLATTIVVMITLLAFIVNIGIFVKAKINLQNATDAAAYAGASVQARQLTNIAYLNWEMRNIYKEWMFKYYVLGGLNLQGVVSPGSSGSMDFTLKPSTSGSRVARDSYNFPSTCIDFAGTGSIGLCGHYSIPGLPRFNSDDVLGMSETTNAFIDALVSEKANDCSERSQINFYSANTWAFNVSETADTNEQHLSDLAPEIAAGRMGAFPAAFEMALRIRNLEAQVNKSARAGVCASGNGHPNCTQSIRDIVTSDQTPSNERLYKAFLSGSKNLGSEADHELRDSFTLTEIAPTDVTFGDAFSLSTLLIPNTRQTKRYLDLKLMTVNYAPFYTAFTSTKGDVDVDSFGNVNTEGACSATKMGLPVPGYPMGFVKNPDLITYYAVKGESQFIGLFNPFSDVPINITAFAAAKPFGGRIGPMLFSTRDTKTIFPRQEGRRSSPYISALDTAFFVDQYGTLLQEEYRPGVPLPLNISSDRFWLQDATSAVGGYAGSGQSIYFGVPNLAYDYPAEDPKSRAEYTSLNNHIQIISAETGATPAGLYNPIMFDKFRNNLRNVGGVVSVQDIDDGILMARAPTLLDAHNYLIPTPEEINADLKTDSFGVIHSPQTREIINHKGISYKVYNHQLYAPLFSDEPDSLYKTAGDIEGVLDDYLIAQEPAIKKYVNAIGMAAQKIYTTNYSDNTGQNLGIDAAEALSDIDRSILASGDTALISGGIPTCKSISGKFAYFYLGDKSNIPVSASCPTSLKNLLMSRWNSFGFNTEYQLEFAIKNNPNYWKQIFSAYRPGIENDGQGDSHRNSLTGNSSVMLRNYYSTKFVSLSSVSNDSNFSYGAGIAVFSQGSLSRGTSQDTAQENFANPIVPSSVDLDLTKIKH